MKKFTICKKKLSFSQSVDCGVLTKQEELQQAINFKSAVQTDLDKPSISLVKKLCYPQQYAFSTNAMRRGCDHESTVVEEFLYWFSVEHEDCNFSNCGFLIDKRYPFLGATPDGIMYCLYHGKYL